LQKECATTFVGEDKANAIKRLILFGIFSEIGFSYRSKEFFGLLIHIVTYYAMQTYKKNMRYLTKSKLKVQIKHLSIK
jgi:hypothetical protein